MQNPDKLSFVGVLRTNTTKMFGSTQTIDRFYEILILFDGPIG